MVQLPTRRSVAETDLGVAPAEAQDLAQDLAQDAPGWDILSEEWLSDEPELESDFHREQITLLLRLMQWYWRNRTDIYCSGNTTVYYDESQRTTRNFKGPDVFVVLGVDPRLRSSWMTWREGGRYPNVVIELLSNSTAKADRTEKKALYENIWRLPEYFWFHPRTLEFKGFRLLDGRYQELQGDGRGHLWSEELSVFLGVVGEQLRLFTPEGELIPLEEQEERRLKEEERRLKEEERRLKEEERRQKEEERRLKEEERRRAELAEARAERLALRLRELGVEVDEEVKTDEF